MDLFDLPQNKNEGPLAARMRPRNLDEYIGQDHIVGKGRLLRRAIAADQLTSAIFYGPPGTGKTTLARVIANHTKSNFITLNAVLAGVQNIRDAIKQADEQRKMYDKKTILFVDEVHRWNKSQQDALLPWVENGTLILVGATTENPFFEVNKALVSRSRVFQLKPLTTEDLTKAALMALNDKERGYGNWKVVFEEGALEHLVETANGDARSLLNALELAVETTPEKWNPTGSPLGGSSLSSETSLSTGQPEPPYGSEIFISKETAEESIQKKVVLYDRDGDYHYDIISAFIKSLRGRDPDAALYWMARMITAGEDPHFIFRRMLISACEDTGLADPNALMVVQSCAEAFDRIGMPEGQYMLTQAALYLATSQKSNSSMAFFDAMKAVQQEDAEVPNHLRDGSRDSEGFGHGAGYLYPHAYKNHWVPQQYLPDGLNGRVFYNPGNLGYEKTVRDEVLAQREMQIAVLLEDEIQKQRVFNDSIESETSSAESVNLSAESREPTSKSGKSSVVSNKTAAESREPTSKSEKSSVVSNTNNSNITKPVGFSITNPMGDWWEAEHLKNGEIKTGETLTFSPGDKKRNAWQKRTDSNKAQVLLEIRNTIIEAANIQRHDRCLIIGADDGLLLWEIWRRSPEGVTAGLCRNEKGKSVLEQYASTLGEIDRPLLAVANSRTSNTEDIDTINDTLSFTANFPDTEFDKIFFRDLITTKDTIKDFIEIIMGLFNKRTSTKSNSSTPEVFLAQKIPSKSQRLAELLIPFYPKDTAPEENQLLHEMLNIENLFFNGGSINSYTQNTEQIEPDTIETSTQRVSQIEAATSIETSTQRVSQSDPSTTTETSNSNNSTFQQIVDNQPDIQNPDKTIESLFSWKTNTIKNEIKEKTSKLMLDIQSTEKTFIELRHISEQEIEKWFSPTSSYGSTLENTLGTAKVQLIKRLFLKHGYETQWPWKQTIAFFAIKNELV